MPFSGLLDVVCPVSVLLGTGTISVRRCLTLERNVVLSLAQSAGEDLQLVINGVTIARGEVMIVDETTALRITEIATAAPEGGS